MVVVCVCVEVGGTGSLCGGWKRETETEREGQRKRGKETGTGLPKLLS